MCLGRGCYLYSTLYLYNLNIGSVNVFCFKGLNERGCVFFGGCMGGVGVEIRIGRDSEHVGHVGQT